jgi:hypothetical protein
LSTNRRLILGAAAAAFALSAAPGAPAAPKSEDPVALERASIPTCPAREVGTESGDGRFLSLRCKGLNSVKAEIVREPRHGKLGAVSQKRDRVRYRPDEDYTGTDHLLVERERRGHVLLTSVRIAVGGGGPLDCNDHHAIARSESPVEIRIRCRGDDLERLKLKGSHSGEVRKVRHSRSRGGDVRALIARFSPDPDFSGQDSIVVGASAGEQSTLGSIGISVLPWRMRAMGDSVTAGFGFLGEGTPMQDGQLLDCRPPDNLNNRCSSNSDNGPDSTAAPEWSTDFGLKNNISWAAQFANSHEPNGKPITAPDIFQNRAVTGSAPTDWLPGGPFNDELEGIIAENPELIAMTMGANPLLSNILLSFSGEECSFETTVADLQACIKPFFDQVDLTGNLQKLYTAILNGTDSSVVVFQYHLADPAAGNFSNWQIEAIIDFFNIQISTAIANTEQALPEQAARLLEIEAQIEPSAPQPDELPRFNIGLPPVSQQTWTASYDCGTGQLVDGPSHQSTVTQNDIDDSSGFCPGDPWVISADFGIHPNADGYKQFAQTLSNVLAANNLLPPSG